MQVPKQKGKRKIINLLNPTDSDIASSEFQQKLRHINNCNATSWKCSQCTVRQLAICVGKVRDYYQMEAFKKYKDDPRYRKAMGERGIDMQRM